MSRPRFKLAIGRVFRQADLLLVLTAVVMVGSTTPALAQNTPVDPEYRGTWVPTKSTCVSPVRFVVAASEVTLINGKDTASFGDVHQAGPSYFGPEYSGILAVVIAEFNGDQPLTATFNVDEKKGVGQVEFAAVTPAPASNVALTKLNARYTKLNLAKRFPLNKVLLKRCS